MGLPLRRRHAISPFRLWSADFVKPDCIHFLELRFNCPKPVAGCNEFEGKSGNCDEKGSFLGKSWAIQNVVCYPFPGFCRSCCVDVYCSFRFTVVLLRVRCAFRCLRIVYLGLSLERRWVCGHEGDIPDVGCRTFSGWNSSSLFVLPFSFSIFV